MERQEKDLRVFFLEDNPDDVELELNNLEKAGFKVTYVIARNKKEFLSKLPFFQPDILLADYSLPDITGIEAINICKSMEVEVPVILITGEGNEQVAVDSLRLGAIDYIIKRNISGLAARITRALEIWADRKAKERAEAEEMRLQHLLFENQKMEAIGRLAGGIAHDFNNILTGIMGFSEICLNEVPRTTNTFGMLQSILTLAQKGADLVKQLLIFSRKMTTEFTVVNFNAFLIETVQFLKRIVEETVDIKLDLQNDISLVRCDTRQFTQVLMNLILNARDAMNGKGEIMIRTEKASPECIPDEGLPVKEASAYICLTVSDTGVGIDKSDIPKIFDPFFTTKGLGKGTGLGLSVVYSVVKAHGGSICVKSEKGLGTLFKIYLPLDETEQLDESPFYEKISYKNNMKIMGSETVLIAEDDNVIRDLVTSFLRASGYNVITARDGEEAFEKYMAAFDKIDLVISDMLMPVKGGIELFTDLLSVKPDVKFILATGYSLVDIDEKLLKKMSAIQTKPYTPARLARLVREVLDNKEARQQTS